MDHSDCHHSATKPSVKQLHTAKPANNDNLHDLQTGFRPGNDGYTTTRRGFAPLCPSSVFRPVARAIATPASCFQVLNCNSWLGGPSFIKEWGTLKTVNPVAGRQPLCLTEPQAPRVPVPRCIRGRKPERRVCRHTAPRTDNLFHLPKKDYRTQKKTTLNSPTNLKSPNGNKSTANNKTRNIILIFLVRNSPTTSDKTKHPFGLTFICLITRRSFLNNSLT